MQIKNAVFLVTGGGSGLGVATVRRLAAAGALVTIVAFRTHDVSAISALSFAFYRKRNRCRSVGQVALMIAFITEGAPIRKILERIGVDSQPPLQ